MIPVRSYQIADSIDIKQLKAGFKSELLHGDADELFYRIDAGTLTYIFKYGVVCFLNASAECVDRILLALTPYCRNLFKDKLSEDFEIETDTMENKFGFNKIWIANPDTDMLRLIMLNVSQSVALDYYNDLTTLLLKETNEQTLNLERKGRLNISGMRLKKFIGRTLNLKNRISENLFIFDSPPETWENENLNKLDLGLKRTFDLQERFRNIQEGLQIARENLELFKDLLQYRKSNQLEWIIIALIFAEIINIVIDRVAQ
jgi:uncharacterized Rmd1/YagE family protein